MATTVLEGALELLVTTASALAESGENNYIIIGGWCPYLRNTSAIQHPGTLDVDVLFKSGDRDGFLASPIRSLLNRGFAASAKHPFQLLIEKDVGNERLIYNVDILHPQMSESDKRMFVDHLELDVPVDDSGRRVKKMRSIVQRSSLVLFEENLFSKYTVSNVEFNLVDFTGMFITKMDSCQKAKRERDSLDIYLGFKSGLVDVEKLKAIRSKHEQIDKSYNRFLKFLVDSPAEFDSNVAEFVEPPDLFPAQVVRQMLGAEI